MEQFVSRIEKESADLHPVAGASIIHSDFVKIHPFIDGNGRTARLMLNFELMEKEQRAEYYSALAEAHTTGDLTSYTKLVSDTLDRTIDRYLKLIG
ncbi:MAG: Filamentation induced by cAMP protein Fic [Paenibacillus sp.]|nr:Filamentation induced by cAMP protein Fic [Paenibacillus sp.]